MANNNLSSQEVFIRCPECGQLSSSIKCYSLPRYFIVFILISWQTITYTCCPKCMLKHILVRCFTYNILTAHMLYPFIILPWGIIYLLRNMTQGHSEEIEELIKQDME